MSDLVLAEKDPATVIAQALADYKATTGVTLAPADPRRLHLQAMLAFLAQMRALIDFSGKQSLLRYVSDQFIDALAELWDAPRLPALPSTTTERFSFATVAARTVAKDVRVTDGANIWTVIADTSATDDHVDAPVQCTVNGAATNGLAAGQIDTLVDPDLVPGCTGVSNLTETVSGRDVEALEDYRERLRDVPESSSTCGPRTAYEQNALKASASVADAAALGPDDGANMAGAAPEAGNIWVLLLEGTRDAGGNLISVIPDPGAGLLSTVSDALTPEDVRPLGDLVTTKAPSFVNFDAAITYYIARSRSDSASSIQAAVAAAFSAWLLWQQSVIGRDINPSELTRLLGNAGAKRVDVGALVFVALKRDQSAKLGTQSLTYGGVEDD